MKIKYSALAVLHCLLFISQLFADTPTFPKQGDYAKFSVNNHFDGLSWSGFLEFEIIKYNADTKQFLVRVTETNIGLSGKKTSEGWEKDLPTSEVVEKTLKDCATSGGKIETIQSHHTCAQETRGDYGSKTQWVGMVPFSVVKVRYEAPSKKTKSPDFFEMRLIEYRFGTAAGK